MPRSRRFFFDTRTMSKSFTKAPVHAIACSTTYESCYSISREGGGEREREREEREEREREREERERECVCLSVCLSV